jgi:hypothetical protein
LCLQPAPARGAPFYGLLYGRAKFSCKTMQLCAMPWRCVVSEIPSISDAMQHRENVRKNAFSNYKSAALPADPRHLRYPRRCSYSYSYLCCRCSLFNADLPTKTKIWRMGGDSNPRCLSAHTLSRRAQSTTLSPILLGPNRARTRNRARFESRLRARLRTTIASDGTVRRVAIECRCRIRRNPHTRR